VLFHIVLNNELSLLLASLEFLEVVAVLGHSIESDAVVNVLAIVQNKSQINKLEFDVDNLTVLSISDVLSRARFAIFPILEIFGKVNGLVTIIEWSFFLRLFSFLFFGHSFLSLFLIIWLAIIVVIFKGFIWHWCGNWSFVLFSFRWLNFWSVFKHGHIDLVIATLRHLIDLLIHLLLNFLSGLVLFARYQVYKMLVQCWFDPAMLCFHFFPDARSFWLRNDFHWFLICLRSRALYFGAIGYVGRLRCRWTIYLCWTFITFSFANLASSSLSFVLLKWVLFLKYLLKRVGLASFIRFEIRLHIVINARLLLLRLRFVLFNSIQLALEILGLTGRQIVMLAKAVENVRADEHTLHSHVQIDAHLMIVVGSVIFYSVRVQGH